MKYLYEPNKFEINAIISEIYNDALDEDGFTVRSVNKKDLIEEILAEFSDPDPDDPEKRIPKISERTAYRWLRKNQEEFGQTELKSRNKEIHETTEKIINHINQNLKSISDDPRTTKNNLGEIKEYTDVLQKLKKLQKNR